MLFNFLCFLCLCLFSCVLFVFLCSCLFCCLCFFSCVCVCFLVLVFVFLFLCLFSCVLVCFSVFVFVFLCLCLFSSDRVCFCLCLRQVDIKSLIAYSSVVHIRLVLCGLMIFSWLMDWGLWGMVPFVVMYMGMMSTVGSNSMALLLSGYPRMAGTASSLAGTLRFGMGSLIGMVVAAMPSDVEWPMVFVMSSCAVLSVLCYWTLGRKA